MLVSDAIAEIVRLVNNPNKANEALLWLKHTLREIWGDGRWQFHIVNKTRQLPSSNGVDPQYLPFPVDFDELEEPIFYRTDTTIGSTISVATTAVDPATVGTAYTYVFQLTGGSDGWMNPSAPWRADYVIPLLKQQCDYNVREYGIEFSPKFNAGGAIWIRYFKKPPIPQHTTDSIPLPDQFVYRLAVYGAARHGLVREDDYDRLQYAKLEFAQALKEMREWDNRRKIANMTNRMTSHLQSPYADYGPGVFPPNFAM